MSPEARERSFDALARGLASGDVSRRRVLKLMGGVLVGGTLASLGLGGVAGADEDEDCKRNGKRCKKDKQCCSGNCEGGTCAAACVPIAGTCSANNQCCSGRCAGGTCAEPCSSDRVLLSNGTCAKPCTSLADCPGCGGCIADASGARYCRDAEGPRSFGCTTDNDCPTGQFCVALLGTPNSCTGVC